MTLQTTGSISFSQIAQEMGDDPPHSMSEMFGLSLDIPRSGKMGFSDFYGATVWTPPSTLTGTPFHITGGLAAPNQAASAEANAGDYGTQEAWPDGLGGFARTTGVYDSVACGNSLNMGDPFATYNSTSAGGVTTYCSIYTDQNFYYSRMCWGGDQIAVLQQLWDTADKQNFLGSIYFRAPRSGSTNYRTNEFQVRDSLGNLLRNRTDWYDQTYAGAFRGVLTWKTDGTGYDFVKDSGASDGLPSHSESGLSLPTEFFTTFNARIYSSYCNSCTANAHMREMRYNHYAP